MATWGPYLQNLGVSIPFNEVWRLLLRQTTNGPSTRRIQAPLSRAGCIQPKIGGSRNALEKPDTRNEKRDTRYVLTS